MSTSETFAFPSDSMGMQRRECARCHRTFKVRAAASDGWAVQRAIARRMPHANDLELDALPAERFCPYCGHGAPEDDWLTAEQRALVEKRADHWLRELRHVQLSHPLRTLGENPNVTYLAVAPEPFAGELPGHAEIYRPFPLLCCREQVRISRAWQGSVHCFYCGSEHVIDPKVPGFEARLDGGIDI